MSTINYPSDLINLTNWYLTLPIGEPEKPTCIYDLKQYVCPPHFCLNETKDAVIFRANCGGVTTSGSSYPRSELREMDGSNKMLWTTSKGQHTMTVKQSVTKLPAVKPSVVVAQIHNTTDDLIEIRVSKQKLEVFHDSTIYGVLDSNYTLGKVYILKIQVIDGLIKIYYNDMNVPKLTISRNGTACFFKTGAYTQSNTSKGDLPEDYAQINIYQLEITHSS